MQFFFLVFFLILSVNQASTHPNLFKEKNCGKALMSRFWSLCPSGVHASEPRQIYYATLMCGVGFTDQEIQNVMCPQQLSFN